MKTLDRHQKWLEFPAVIQVWTEIGPKLDISMTTDRARRPSLGLGVSTGGLLKWCQRHLEALPELL
jgi:hypothetical protein